MICIKVETTKEEEIGERATHIHNLLQLYDDHVFLSNPKPPVYTPAVQNAKINI
jgi:hypothetical protein